MGTWPFGTHPRLEHKWCYGRDEQPHNTMAMTGRQTCWWHLSVYHVCPSVSSGSPPTSLKPVSQVGSLVGWGTEEVLPVCRQLLSAGSHQLLILCKVLSSALVAQSQHMIIHSLPTTMRPVPCRPASLLALLPQESQINPMSF